MFSVQVLVAWLLTTLSKGPSNLFRSTNLLRTWLHDVVGKQCVTAVSKQVCDSRHNRRPHIKDRCSVGWDNCVVWIQDISNSRKTLLIIAQSRRSLDCGTRNTPGYGLLLIVSFQSTNLSLHILQLYNLVKRRVSGFHGDSRRLLSSINAPNFSCRWSYWILVHLLLVAYSWIPESFTQTYLYKILSAWREKTNWKVLNFLLKVQVRTYKAPKNWSIIFIAKSQFPGFSISRSLFQLTRTKSSFSSVCFTI